MLKGADYADRVSSSASTLGEEEQSDEIMPGLFSREQTLTPFGQQLHKFSPYLAQHYRSMDLYGGLFLLIGSIVVFASFLYY